MSSQIESFHPPESEDNPIDEKARVRNRTHQELANLAGRIPKQPPGEFVSTSTPRAPLEYTGEPLVVPLRGETTINFQGPGASIRLPRSDWFCAEVHRTPPLRELWGNDAHCDGRGPI